MEGKLKTPFCSQRFFKWNVIIRSVNKVEFVAGTTLSASIHSPHSVKENITALDDVETVSEYLNAIRLTVYCVLVSKTFFKKDQKCFPAEEFH